MNDFVAMKEVKRVQSLYLNSSNLIITGYRHYLRNIHVLIIIYTWKKKIAEGLYNAATGHKRINVEIKEKGWQAPSNK